MNLHIKNCVCFHYEIIESLIVKYKEIINMDVTMNIYLSIVRNDSFINYIKHKYPTVIFGPPSQTDFEINATIYDRDYGNIIRESNKYFYVSHEITPRMNEVSNVYFLTPLAKRHIYFDILPFHNYKVQTKIPIFVIQGNITRGRRNYSLLLEILKHTYDHDFRIKFIGKGTLPNDLTPFQSKFILKLNLPFQEFHKEFSDAYCIMPLILKESHKHYYTTKLTSTINYTRGYNLKCLIDKDLQNIYNLENVEIFNNKNDIVDAFKKTLYDFYN